MARDGSPADVQWIGNTFNWPSNGSITSLTHLWVNTQTYPIGSATEVEVVYSTDGACWHSAPLSRNGTAGNNDQWHVDLGALPSGTPIQYALKAVGNNVQWDNNGGRDFRARVNIAAGDICSSGLSWNGYTSTISVRNGHSTTRSYVLSTNQPGRKEATRTGPNGGICTFSEQPEQPVTRTGNDLFDGLFALAYDEMRQMSVDGIRDDSYNDGKIIPCPTSGGWFQTGERWHYAWTRDTAYSVELALAQLDPIRSMNTLLFKTSPRRSVPTDVDTTEIVQDTGSGGSWPVSTDRVVWARGAWELLKYLSGETRRNFEAWAYTAIVNTIENDRRAAYDTRDGLYRGELSFLDWREQIYPSWTADNVVHIGMSKALSTNVNHWKILDVAAQISAELGKPEANRYRDWANQLKRAINTHLWLTDSGLFGMVKTTEPHAATAERYELLGEALAILDGIADSARTSSILSRYPHTVAGAPVVWPQIRGQSVYHNAAIWPFVSAYMVKAASAGKNDAVVNNNLLSMMRGAALNLSHMENYHFIDLGNQPPEIDSEAQLWSIAGYLNMVLDVTFGHEASQTGFRFIPFVTKLMRNKLFAGTSTLELRGLRYKARVVNVIVDLPAPDGLLTGYYLVHSVSVNGVAHAADQDITLDQLGDTNRIVVRLVDANAAGGLLSLVEDNSDWRQFWAPLEPTVDPSNGVTLANGKLTVHWDAHGETGTDFDIYRNGKRVAARVSGTSWLDPDSSDYASTVFCYAVAQRYGGNYPVENVSCHSEPVCFGKAETIAADDARITTNDGTKPIADHGRSSYSNWGYASQTMDIAFVPAESGTYQLQVQYGNGFNFVGEGITNCVKRVEIFDAKDQLVATGVVIMPHRSSWASWGRSSYLSAALTGGTLYRIHIRDFYNMSYLESNATYNHAGGKQGPVNRANISGISLRRMSPPR